MTERERLVELILNAPKLVIPFGNRAQGKTYQTAVNIADHLLANGVIAPPCRGGDKVYRIFPRISDAIPPWVGATPETVERIGIATKNPLGNWNVYPIDDIGKTVFLTREEAEAALAERSDK